VLYAGAPQPIVAFDADLRAIYARTGPDAWTLMRGRGSSSYARERLGAMLGLSPPIIERLAPPESCGEGGCTWNSPGGRAMLFARDEASLAQACALADAADATPNNAPTVIITALAAPPDLTPRCAHTTLIHAPDIARLGGALIYETPASLRVLRAWPANIARPWTRRAPGADQE
jgi:competence protein ComEC